MLVGWLRTAPWPCRLAETHSSGQAHEKIKILSNLVSAGENYSRNRVSCTELAVPVSTQYN